MNYEKYLSAAGVPQELHQQALGYMAKCERDYKTARIAWHEATAWAVVRSAVLTLTWKKGGPSGMRPAKVVQEF